MLQRAIEESKQDAQGGINPDDMTYEELLALEEENGKVSKGLTQQQIRKIPERMWSKVSHGEKCSICFENFTTSKKVKELKKCKHAYHS